MQAERERIRVEEEARAEQRAAAARLEEQRLADAKARADQAEAQRAAAAPAPTGILDRGESAAGKALVNAMAPPPAPAPRADEPATLKLGTICERLGFTVTAGFVEMTLGISPAATNGAAKMYRESDYTRICNRLITRLHELVAACSLREAA